MSWHDEQQHRHDDNPRQGRQERGQRARGQHGQQQQGGYGEHPFAQPREQGGRTDQRGRNDARGQPRGNVPLRGRHPGDGQRHHGQQQSGGQHSNASGHQHHRAGQGQQGGHVNHPQRTGQHQSSGRGRRGQHRTGQRQSGQHHQSGGHDQTGQRDQTGRVDQSGRDQGTGRRHQPGGHDQAGRGGTSVHGSRGGDRAQSFGSERMDDGGRMPERAYGDRRRSPLHENQGNPRGVSQRGSDSVQGVSGHVGSQYGDHHDESRSWSATHGFHSEEQFAGETGESERGHRYGSRRGHGTRRREDPHVRDDRSR